MNKILEILLDAKGNDLESIERKLHETPPKSFGEFEDFILER